MLDILAWAVSELILAVMVRLSVGVVCCSEKASSTEAERETA